MKKPTVPIWRIDWEGEGVSIFPVGDGRIASGRAIFENGRRVATEAKLFTLYDNLDKAIDRAVRISRNKVEIIEMRLRWQNEAHFELIKRIADLRSEHA
jgi:hypothetical protein